MPVFASRHWTILKAEKAAPEQTKQQVRIGKLLNENFKLSEARSNLQQPVARRAVSDPVLRMVYIIAGDEVKINDQYTFSETRG